MDIGFLNPMDFGMGIDSLTLRPRNPNAVTADVLKEVRGTGATQTVELSLLNAKSMEDYESTFSFGADASVTYGLFHGSASFNFAQVHKFHSFSRFLLVSLKVTNTFKQIDQPKLNPLTDGADLLANGDPARFQEEFGDSFVLGIQQGGMFFAILEFTSESQSDFDSVSGALDIGVFGLFDASASFSSEIHKYKGHTNLKVNTFQQGGTDTSPRFDIDGIIERVKTFPSEVRAAAESYSVVLMDYRAIHLPKPPNIIQIDNAKLVLQRFYRLRAQILQTLNDIEYVRANPEQFINPDKFDFKQAEVELTNALDTITAAASTCANNVTECKFVPVSIPVFSLPERIKSTMTTVPPVVGLNARTDPRDGAPGADDILRKAGLTMNPFAVPGDHNQQDLVLSQEPNAGTPVAKGTGVSVGVGVFDG